ncbi:unnamed protein product [Callosobruchus maculatus]|uniref:Uncharacterized protein n=1 Tax=Callosobruchus maculatus TaxID=64391 RepID=A0A653C0M4_CALMS|nr:unnamed protein product [Callosobruchus maculatus]
MRKEDRIVMCNIDNKRDTHTRSQKVKEKENIGKEDECMFNRELQVNIRRENEKNTQFKRTEKYRFENNKVSSKVQQISHTRSEKAKKENIKLGKRTFSGINEKESKRKLNRNNENKENYYRTADIKKLKSSDNIDKLHQKCVVELVRFEPQQDEKCILKNSTTSNSERNDKTRIIVEDSYEEKKSSDLFGECTTPKGNASVIENPTSKDKLYQKCVLKLVRFKLQQGKKCILENSSTCNIEGSDKTRITVRDSCNTNRNSDSFEECTTPKTPKVSASFIENPTSKSDTLEASIVRCDGNDSGDIVETKFRKACAILHSDILGIQTSTPLRSSNPTTPTPVAKRLRNNEKKNYRESSLSLAEPLAEAEVPSDPVGKKVPIYKRNIPDEHKPKADLYEFDDIEIDVPRRKKRKNTSKKFDRTMHSILEKLEKKEKTNRRCMKNYGKVPIYETKINAALEKVLHKIKAKSPQNSLASKQNNCKKNKENEPQIQNQLILDDHNKNKSCQKSPLNEALCNWNRQHTVCNGYNKINNHNVADNTIIDSTNDINIMNQNENCYNAIYTDDSSLYPSENSNLSDFCGFSNTKSMLAHERSDVTDGFQGFSIQEQSRAEQKSSLITNHLSTTFGRKNTSIKILGNILLRPAQKDSVKKIAAFDYFIDLHENYTLDNNFGFDYDEKADSSMIAQAQKIVKKIVWRFASVIKRNPHFLLIKSNALPYLNQDLIINYALVEWIEKKAALNHTQNPAIKDPLAKVIYQKKISEYIECPITLQKDYENAVLSSSLYDYEEFHIPVRPRRVLGILQNDQVISTPKSSVGTSVPLPDISIIEKDKGYHAEDDAENTPPEHSLQIRASICEIRKYSRKSKDKKNTLEKEVVVAHLQQLINSDANSEIVTKDKQQNVTNDDEPGNDIQLFDEDEPELLENLSIIIPKMNYPTKRRKRLKSDASDLDDEGKPKKKKKDLMTEEEKIEFEKWASKFNAMCEEVDKYELEVD